MTQLTDDLLRKAHRAALRHNKLRSQIIDAVIDRYGNFPSDVDYDDLVGGYDSGTIPRVVDCDVLVSAYGSFPKMRNE